jgi:excisionase family DNA binding protein
MQSCRAFSEVFVEMRQPLKIKSPMLVVDEVARFLRTHPTTIYRLIKSKKIPAFRVGSEWRFDREEVDRWIKTQQNIASGTVQKEKSHSGKIG